MRRSPDNLKPENQWDSLWFAGDDRGAESSSLRPRFHELMLFNLIRLIKNYDQLVATAKNTWIYGERDLGMGKRMISEVYSSMLITMLVGMESRYGEDFDIAPTGAPVIIDGSGRSGTSSLSRSWEVNWKYELMQTGVMFRLLGLIAIELNISSEEMIRIAALGKLFFTIKRGDGGQRFYEVVSTDELHPFSNRFTQHEVDEMKDNKLRRDDISAFARDLNNDPTKAVQDAVIAGANTYLNTASRVVVEGRNAATFIENPYIHAYLLFVSDGEAQRREVVAERQRRKKVGEPPMTMEDEEEKKRLIALRNQRDRDNDIAFGTLMAAFRSGKYSVLYNTDLAGPKRIALSTFIAQSYLTRFRLAATPVVAQVVARSLIGFDPVRRSFATLTPRIDRRPPNSRGVL